MVAALFHTSCLGQPKTLPKRMPVFPYTGLCCCLYMLMVTFQTGKALRAHVVNSTEYRDVITPHSSLFNNSFKVEGTLHLFDPYREEQECRIVESNEKGLVVAIVRQGDASETCFPTTACEEEQLCVGVIQVMDVTPGATHWVATPFGEAEKELSMARS